MGPTTATMVGKHEAAEPSCMLRSCVRSLCPVGACSMLLEGSMMEPKSVLGPGSVLSPAWRVPTGELGMGNPVRFVRKVVEDEMDLFVGRQHEVGGIGWAFKHRTTVVGM